MQKNGQLFWNPKHFKFIFKKIKISIYNITLEGACTLNKENCFKQKNFALAMTFHV